jgi:hypothetical protein
MALLIFALATGLAWAGPLVSDNGRVGKWDRGVGNGTIQYFLDPALLSRQQADATAAFAKWQAVPGSFLTFSSTGTEASNQINVKYYPGERGAAPARAVYTTDGDGHIQQCEVQVFGDVAEITDERYLASLMLHEVGHCLGLGHSITARAVMSYLSGDPIDLSDDDRAALLRLYSNEGEDYPMGCATVNDVSGPRGGGGPRLFELALLLAMTGAGAIRITRASASC